jgi:hypothetical protein
MNAAFEAELRQELKDHAKIIATISFGNFGRREIEPIAPALMELHNYILQIVKQFAALLL